MDLENIVMQIIINSGEARSHCLNAIREARQKNYSKAEELLQTAKEALSRAHQIQTEMIQEEIRGNGQPVSMIMVHAQDHLMNALTVRDLATEMIEIVKNQNIKE
ncbi:PTS lactose/cellobiose transporter subunit IIA [Limnobaculum xujianqingii]|uniref:PTS lactose/cellobiose transporter subunit IIA n=1 Tax=Limnobaculum xujianqingii TaxID=2738837 RepID=UPI00112C182A|nr:PTS lactose/cellobiose transporter subunit IIA [Limnobaculum xujianqingii]